MDEDEKITLLYKQLADIIMRVTSLEPLHGVGAPTSLTPAYYLGQLYIDDATNKSYICLYVPEEESGESGESGEQFYYLWEEVGGSIEVDDHLDANSTNPVENKVITAAIGNVESVLHEINNGEGS